MRTMWITLFLLATLLVASFAESDVTDAPGRHHSRSKGKSEHRSRDYSRKRSRGTTTTVAPDVTGL